MIPSQQKNANKKRQQQQQEEDFQVFRRFCRRKHFHFHSGKRRRRRHSISKMYQMPMKYIRRLL